MKILILLLVILILSSLKNFNEKFKIKKNKNKINCKFPRGCPTRRTKGMWYGLRGYPKTYRKMSIGSYFHRLFPFFHASSRSPYQVYPNKILSK